MVGETRETKDASRDAGCGGGWRQKRVAAFYHQSARRSLGRARKTRGKRRFISFNFFSRAFARAGARSERARVIISAALCTRHTQLGVARCCDSFMSMLISDSVKPKPSPVSRARHHRRIRLAILISHPPPHPASLFCFVSDLHISHSLPAL